MSSKILISMVVLCLMVLQYSLVSSYRFPRSDEEDSSDSNSSSEDEDSSESAEVTGCDPLQEISLLDGLAADNITASSFVSVRRPVRSKFNVSGYWQASSSPGQFIQYQFAVPRTFTKIATKGCCENTFVTLYDVAYSTDADCLSLTLIPQSFQGNTDGRIAVTNTFTNPFTAQCVRVLPLEFSNSPSLQVDLIGC